jgi:galactofuranosylgalactofuranosylrhamnosyl-N-acetylglucosaminyl-diphospho-decaprenol beta-1,5/1,6-galactofuranosyltransferase
MTESNQFELSTNTYFNRFAAGHWAQASSLKEVEVQLVADFDGVVEVVGLSSEGTFLIFRGALTQGNKIYKTFFPQGLKSVWINFYSQHSISENDFDFEFHSKNHSYLALPSSIAICTYNKPSFVERNLAILSQNLDSSLINKIIVVNQGSEIVKLPNHPSFEIIEQENLGGSGGFSRGLSEFLKIDSQGILLMDDDIIFIPEIIYRIFRFASLGNNEFAISTQMLNLFKPDEVWSDQEIVDLTILWSALHGRRLFSANSDPEFIIDGNMVGWWCGYFPRSYIEQIGLPLPLFIHWDDIEYSLRMQNFENFSVKTVFGFGVWHEPFDSKAQWGWISYFDIRNALIGSAVHKAKFLDAYKKITRVLIVTIMSHRYQANSAVVAGIRDFFNGPACLSIDQRRRAVDAFNQVENGEFIFSMKPKFSLLGMKVPGKWLAIIRHVLSVFKIVKPQNANAWTTRNFTSSKALQNSAIIEVFSRYGGTSEILIHNPQLARRGYLSSLALIMIFPFRWHPSKRRWIEDFDSLISEEFWDALRNSHK